MRVAALAATAAICGGLATATFAPVAASPTRSPTSAPTPKPTEGPTPSPTPIPTVVPTATDRPTFGPTDSPTLALPSDTELVRPEQDGPSIATIVAYNWKSRDDWLEPPGRFELPIYQHLNRDDDDYWNFLVDELLLARVDTVMLSSRGCWNAKSGDKGPGNMCPRHLSKFTAAVQRAGAQNVIRVGLWENTGSKPALQWRLEDIPKGTKMSLADANSWNYFWDHDIKIWFDTLPRELWFLMDGKPVICFWNLGKKRFTKQQGNASRMLAWITDNFRLRYGIEPALILQRDWFELDNTINETIATGKHNWFFPVQDVATSTYTYAEYNGELWGMAAPSFRNDQGSTEVALPGCGEWCREVTRRDGDTLNDALNFGESVNAKFILIEGWTDMVESAGLYRSLEWRYPTQYINLIRRYADPAPETLRFQAEGADLFYDTTPTNLGGEYADRSLDVAKLDDNTGWFVGWTEPGEWIEYREIELGCGTYRFTARVATSGAGKRIRLNTGLPGGVDVPRTGGIDQYALLHLGETKLEAGTYDIRLTFEASGSMMDQGNATLPELNIDWFFLKRSSLDC